MSIKIKTHLRSGIYKSQGGGETRTHYEFAKGPRNLLKAIDTLRAHRERMRQTYGNVGCGASWIEIDGKGISDHDLAHIEQDDAQAFGNDAPAGLVKTRTQKARELLEATDRQYTIVAAWTGQDGRQWREIEVCVGNGFRHYLQREVSPGVWG